MTGRLTLALPLLLAGCMAVTGADSSPSPTPPISPEDFAWCLVTGAHEVFRAYVAHELDGGLTQGDWEYVLHEVEKTRAAYAPVVRSYDVESMVDGTYVLALWAVDLQGIPAACRIAVSERPSPSPATTPSLAATMP